MAQRTGTLIAVAAGLAAVFTLVVSVLPFVSFAYRSVEAHMVIETAAAFTTGTAALLLYGRVREYGRRSDLVLFGALLLFAGTNLLFSVVPPILAIEPGGGFSTWAPVAGRVCSAATLTWAAFASPARLAVPDAGVRRTLLLVGGTLALIALLAVPLSSALPHAIDPELSPEAGSRPRIVGDPVVLAMQALTMVLYAAAAYGFLRQVRRNGEELSSWLAVAATVGAFARLNYLLFPSLYSDWVYTGDVLRLAFFVLLCLGAAREIIRTQRLQSEARVLEDRRRIARDIHDGLAQELAFITTHASRLGPRTVGRREDQLVLVGQLRDAAQRALDESRAAIEALSTARDEPLGEAVCRAAENVAERYGAQVRAETENGFTVPREVRDGLVRIAREAAANAVRHGEAKRLQVELRGPSPIVLRIADDGAGFDPASVGRGGFGLTSMRERAEALGGELRVVSAPGEGTTVEARVP